LKFQISPKSVGGNMKKKKKKTSKIILVVICVMITLYTAANFVLQYFAGVEVSPTLTTAWFAFWGTELIALAAIKTTKVKHNKEKETIENPHTEKNEQAPNKEGPVEEH
jgi:biotin transporter BioY